MSAPLNGLSICFIASTVFFGVAALVLASVGIGTPNWQVTSAVINRDTFTVATANFFYACRFFPNNTLINCSSRSVDRNIQQYYPIDARWNQTEWNSHLDNAAGLCITGIVCIFLGVVATIMMVIGRRLVFIYVFGPILFFLACLFMLAGMAEGAYVLYYNGYAANLYQTGHLLTILSFFISCVAAGRLSCFSDTNELVLPVLKQ